MKSIKIIITSFILLFFSHSFCLATTVELNPAKVTQGSGTSWCWAACDRSIIKQYTDSSPFNTNIVAWVDCGDEDGDAPYDRSATVDETRSALTHWGVTSSRWYDDLSWTAVQSQINNNHLCIACFVPTSGTGHAELICGWSNTWPGGDRVQYMEPQDGDYHWRSYDSFADGEWLGTSWSWAASIFSCQ